MKLCVDRALSLTEENINELKEIAKKRCKELSFEIKQYMGQEWYGQANKTIGKKEELERFFNIK